MRYDEACSRPCCTRTTRGERTETVGTVLAHGLRCALTGGLALAAQLRAHGRPVERRRLNDIDLVVHGFGAIPESVTGSFLLHHVHPDAIEGKTLVQLIDESTAVRVDLFRTFGNTLTRASALDDETGALHVLSIEDLVARTTALVCGSLRRRKHVGANEHGMTRQVGPNADDATREDGGYDAHAGAWLEDAVTWHHGRCGDPAFCGSRSTLPGGNTFHRFALETCEEEADDDLEASRPM